MRQNIVFERDLLYPTDNVSEPGSIHVEVMNPTRKGKIPVVIESKTSHSPVKYIKPIVSVIQGDVFDRINVDLKANISLYIKANDDLKREYGNKEYLLVDFRGNEFVFSALDELDL